MIHDDLEDIDAWRALKAEVENWPKKEGERRVRFHGEPEFYDHTATCPDCHRIIRSHGVSFGPYDPAFTVAGHQSADCPAWRNRLWRFRHHTLRRWAYAAREALRQ